MYNIFKPKLLLPPSQYGKFLVKIIYGKGITYNNEYDCYINTLRNTNFENTFSETISTNVYKCDTGLDTF